jgi:hypothetical protein
MSSNEEYQNRLPPRRLIDKRQGLRHIIHAAIRMIFEGEDPFAIHVLVQSAEKIETDLLRKAGKSDLLPIDKLVLPSKKQEFYHIWRESYNFLKHADKDHDGSLPVYDIVRTNDVLLLVCIGRYRELFGGVTRHMQQFLRLAIACYPHLLEWPDIQVGQRFLEARAGFENISRGELLAVIKEDALQNIDYLRERSHDLVDVLEASEKLISGENPKPTFENQT